MKVIFVMSDSYRRDHLGLYNKNLHTPYLDQLAGTACVFDNAYIGSFPTGPNRRDINVGKGVEPGCAFNPWKGLEGDETPFAHRLTYEKDVCTMMISDCSNQTTHGANMFKGYRYYRVNRGQEADGWWCDQEVDVSYDVPQDVTRYRKEMYENIKMDRAFRRYEDDYFAPKTFRWGCEWLERNYKRDDFFLFLETFDPHEPWDPPQYYIDRYDPGYKGRVIEFPPYGYYKKLGITDREVKHMQARYAAECTMVDQAMGRLLATLEKLNILEETVIVFTSDHGINAGLPGDNGLVGKPWFIDKKAGAWLKGGRFETDEIEWLPMRTGTIRIPLLIKMPKQSKKQRIARIAQPWDMAPTILELFGLRQAEDQFGESLLPVMKGRKPKKNRPYAFTGHYMHDTHLAQAVNSRYIYGAWSDHAEEPWLIDLKNDPSQRYNVAKKHPEVCRRMHAAMTDFNPKPFADK